MTKIRLVKRTLGILIIFTFLFSICFMSLKGDWLQAIVYVLAVVIIGGFMVLAVWLMGSD